MFKENTKELEEQIEKGSIDQTEFTHNSLSASIRSLAGSSDLPRTKVGYRSFREGAYSSSHFYLGRHKQRGHDPGKS
jgi:hypothetical protein